ncbi:U3 snoRNP protein, partial [Borealophlyctis nickersoniae]
MSNIMVDTPNPLLPQPKQKQKQQQSRKRKAVEDPSETQTSPAATNANASAKKRKRKKKKKSQGAAPITESSSLPVDRGIAAAEELSEDEKDLEELELEDLVFGADAEGRIERVLERAGHELEDGGDLDGAGYDGAGSDQGDDDDDEPALDFVIDRGGDDTADAAADAEDVDEEHETALKPKPAAWEDEDDVMVNIVDTKRLRKLRTDYSEEIISGKDYEARLRAQFEKIHPKPEWATIPAEGEDTDDLLSVLRKTHGIVSRKKTRVLNSDRLEIVRLKDANQMAYSQAVVQSVTFHPTAPVVMTAGYDKTLRLFQIDGKVNPKIQSIYIKDLPIHKAAFTPDGKQVIMAGQRKYFYVFDVESGGVEKVPYIRGHEDDTLPNMYASPCNTYLAFIGRDGYVMLVSRTTKQWVADLKTNGYVKSLAFSADGKFLFTFGGNGDVCQWDLDTKSCIHRFIDDGCVKPTVIAVSPNGKYIATG